MEDVQQPASESFKQLKERLAVEQAGMTKEDVIRQTGGIDLDNLPSVKHVWVDRGAKVSCEGAAHPHHSHFKVPKR